MEIMPIALRTTAGVAGIWVLVAAVIMVAIKAWPVLRKMQLEADGSLRSDLLARISALEAKVELSDQRVLDERMQCDERIERLEARYEVALDEVKGEVQVLRHDRNNMRQGVNFLLVSIRRLDNPELSSIAEAAEQMIARGEELIAVEKGAMKGKRT